MIWGHGLVYAAGAAGFLLTATCANAAARDDRAHAMRIAEASPSEAIDVRLAAIAAKAGTPHREPLSREELISVFALFCARNVKH